jgi:hypothetical protein
MQNTALEQTAKDSAPASTPAPAQHKLEQFRPEVVHVRDINILLGAFRL